MKIIYMKKKTWMKKEMNTTTSEHCLRETWQNKDHRTRPDFQSTYIVPPVVIMLSYSKPRNHLNLIKYRILYASFFFLQSRIVEAQQDKSF